MNEYEYRGRKASLSRQIDQLEFNKKNIRQACEDFCQNKEIPLSFRWDIWRHLSPENKKRNLETLTPFVKNFFDFDAETCEKLRTYSENKSEIVFEEFVDLLEEEEFAEAAIAELKEAILADYIFSCHCKTINTLYF